MFFRLVKILIFAFFTANVMVGTVLMINSYVALGPLTTSVKAIQATVEFAHNAAEAAGQVYSATRFVYDWWSWFTSTPVPPERRVSRCSPPSPSDQARYSCLVPLPLGWPGCD